MNKIFEAFKPYVHTKKRICPHCGGRRLRREKRYFWMRLIQDSKYYHCLQCRRKTLLIGVISKRSGYKRRRSSTDDLINKEE